MPFCREVMAEFRGTGPLPRRPILPPTGAKRNTRGDAQRGSIFLLPIRISDPHRRRSAWRNCAIYPAVRAAIRINHLLFHRRCLPVRRRGGAVRPPAIDTYRIGRRAGRRLTKKSAGN